MKIGKINFDLNQIEDLQPHLTIARNKGYKLIYVFLKDKEKVSQTTLSIFNGKLVDRKVLFEQKIETISGVTDEQITEFCGNRLTKELEYLTYLSGTFSRFKTDPGFASDDYYRLYKTWMIKSLKKEIADKVIVYNENDTTKGMVTLKIKETYGEIGLIAVDEHSHGKGIGKKLINNSLREVKRNRLSLLRVSTQEENTTACKFYEKSGFKVKNITNIYHFWV